MKKRLLLMLTFFCLIGGSAWGQSFIQGVLGFIVIDSNAKTVAVTKAYNNITGALVIPSTVTNGGVTYTVTAVASEGFYQTNITSVTIPASVTSLGSASFAWCRSLQRIVFEDSDNLITLNEPYFLFQNSNANKTVYIGRNIELTTNHAPFPNVTSVEFGDKVTTINDYLFFLAYKLSNVIMGSGITSIGESAFYFAGTDENVDEMHVEMGSNVKTIDRGAFNHCERLKSITLPPTLKTIDNDAFGTSGLTAITIPASVESIGGGAFAECYSLQRIVFEDSENSISVRPNVNDGGTFERSNANKTVYIGRNLNLSGNYAPFPNATSVEFGKEVTGLSPYMFSNTTLSNVKVPWQTPINIDENVFNNATYENALLSVPGGTLNKYKAHAVWKKFLNVQPTSYAVSATVTAGGTLKFAGETVTNGFKSLYIDRGSDVTFEVTPDENYDFTSLKVAGRTVSLENNTYTYANLLKDITVQATFTEKPKFDITATATGGMVSLNGETPSASQSISAYSGTAVTLAVQAYEGHYLSSVIINDIDVTDQLQDNTLTLEDIQEAKTIVVTFLKYTYTVSISGVGITVSNMNPQYGDNVTVTIEDDPDRTLVSLIVNGVDVTDQVVNGQYVIQNVTGNVTIEATFKSTKEFITLTGTYATFSCSQDLNFTGSDLRAYIASGFNRATSQVLLTRVTDVPAGTGVFLVGEPGTTYKVPYSETNSIYMNFFQANLQKSTVAATTGNFSNYTFGEQDGDPGFYPINGSTTLLAQTAYLQLPTSFVAPGVKVSVVFEDDVIDGIESLTPALSEGDGEIFDLAGRRLGKTQRGINIVNGKKIVIK